MKGGILNFSHYIGSAPAPTIYPISGIHVPHKKLELDSGGGGGGGGGNSGVILVRVCRPVF